MPKKVITYQDARFFEDCEATRRQCRADLLRTFLLLATLAAIIFSFSGCMVAKGNGTTWSLTSVGTDYSDLDLSGAGMKAREINQSVTYSATVKAVKAAWSNYLMAEGLKWVAGKYYDHQNQILEGPKVIELEKLRNAKSAADSAAALETLKVTSAIPAA